MFKKASRKQSKLRLLLEGASGSGKTYSALTIAKGIGNKVAVIDTEKGSASLYSSDFDFDVCELSPPYTPEAYVEAIKFAEKDYDVIIIDSITHEWSGEGGCLDIQSKLGGRYQDWAKVTPRHDSFVEAILSCKSHIIATARTKTAYEVSKNPDGKTKVNKMGTKTEQRDGLDYEFTSVLRINENHMFEATKDRTGLFDGKEAVFTEDHGKMLVEWLNEGENANDSDMADELVGLREKISSQETLEDLKNLWSTISKDNQKSLKNEKDKRKSELSAQEN